MPNKWVDNNEYFGPDRRRRPVSKRWGERRHENEAGDLPPLGALLRRLRVQMLGLATPQDYQHALQMLSGAIGEANRLGYRQCAASLMAADRILRDTGPKHGSAADPHLVEAMDHAGAGR